MRSRMLWLAVFAALSCGAALSGASASRSADAAPGGAHALPRISGAAAPHTLRPSSSRPATSTVLYDQYDNPGANATSSQHFEAAFSTYDDELADDFTVPAGETWSVTTIDAAGEYFDGPGPATSFNVVFYSNSTDLPGTAVATRTTMSFTQLAEDFTISLSPAVTLTSGTYWVSVQANQVFNTSGQWGWFDRTVQSNQGAAWRNPGGGFGVGLYELHPQDHLRHEHDRPGPGLQPERLDP